MAKILITVDGKVQEVEVFLSVAKTTVPAATTPVSVPATPAPGSGPSKPTGIVAAAVVLILIFGCFVIGALAIGGHVASQQNQQYAQETQTEQAWQMQYVIEPTLIARQEIHALTLLTFKDAQMITGGQDPWNLCSKPFWGKNGMTCNPGDHFVKFTLMNNSQYMVNITDIWCWTQRQIDTGVLPYMDYCTSVFEVPPSSEITIYCRPSSVQGPYGGREAFLVSVNDHSGWADPFTGQIYIP